MPEAKNPAGTGGARYRAKALVAGASELSTSTPKPKAGHAETSPSFSRSQENASHRERDADYRHIVTELSDRWRLIVCRDGLQWIIQRRDGERSGRARWTGVYYCQTREALIRPQPEA